MEDNLLTFPQTNQVNNNVLELRPIAQIKQYINEALNSAELSTDELYNLLLWIKEKL